MPLPVPDLILTTWLVLGLPAFMLARSLARRGRTPGGNRIGRYQQTMGIVAASLVALAAWWIDARRSLAQLGLGAPDRTGVVLIAVVLAVLALLAVAAPNARRPTDPARVAAARAMLPQDRRELRWFLAFAVIVGAGWEILYRGYLFGVLGPVLGATGAVAVMAVSYGVAHGYRGPGALAGSIVSAACFAGAYALTGSLWWLIMLHIGLPLIGLRVRPTPA